MSPDRTTITRAEAIRRRKAEELRQKEIAAQRSTPKLRTGPEPESPSKLRFGWTDKTKTNSTVSRIPRDRSYNIAMSTPYGYNKAMQAAEKESKISFSLPKFRYGPRWISLLIVIFCFADLYFMLNYEPFIVHDAQITGNQRIGTQDIQNVLGIYNQSAAILNPAQIQTNIMAAFPDVSDVQVEVSIPNNVNVTVTERTPVAAWHQDGQVVWVDFEGFAFPPRGQVDGLLSITASGAPITLQTDPTVLQIGARPFLQPGLFHTIEAIIPYLPQGASLIYDPIFGLGWTDPQGWKVYFGNSNGDTNLKLQIYQTMLDFLKKKSIKPVLISVEYPDAPFYRVEQ